MNDEQVKTYKAFDELLDPKGPVMLVGKQLLKVGSFDSEKTEIIFPPSYANPSEKKDDPPVYNIDPPYDPKDPLTHNNVCVLDSIPSQANRMEPLFGEPPHDMLVPQYRLKFNDELPIVNITQIGHRIADAAFRGTSLRAEIVAAFKAYSNGNAENLARIGPTSLVFGVWDSRGTGVKVPRLVNSIIRAFKVAPLKRSAQYVPPIKYEQEGMIPAGLEGKPADHGLADVPSTHKIGGIQVNGEIRRDFSLNLELLRELKATSVEETKKLQRYILGLALLAFCATQKTHLRQGCQLLPNGDPKWKLFLANGKEATWTLPANIEELAASAANAFGITQPNGQPLVFDKGLLKASIDADAKKKADKKAESAGDPIVNLQKMVAELEPVRGDKFSTARTARLTKLQEAVAAIETDSATSDELKSLVASLRPLLIADEGAAARKAEMLRLFPASEEQPTSSSGEATTDDNTEGAQ